MLWAYNRFKFSEISSGSCQGGRNFLLMVAAIPLLVRSNRVDEIFFFMAMLLFFPVSFHRLDPLGYSVFHITVVCALGCAILYLYVMPCCPRVCLSLYCYLYHVLCLHLW